MQGEHNPCSGLRSVKVHCRCLKGAGLCLSAFGIEQGGWVEAALSVGGKIVSRVQDTFCIHACPLGLQNGTPGVKAHAGRVAACPPRSLCAGMAPHPSFIRIVTRNFGEALHQECGVKREGGWCFRVTVCVCFLNGVEQNRSKRAARSGGGSLTRRSVQLPPASDVLAPGIAKWKSNYHVDLPRTMRNGIACSTQTGRMLR